MIFFFATKGMESRYRAMYLAKGVVLMPYIVFKKIQKCLLIIHDFQCNEQVEFPNVLN